MAIYGYTKLELGRGKNVVKRIEKHNDITDYMQGIHKQGNYGGLIPWEKMRPLTQFLDGCILTDDDNVVSEAMIAHGANITACAGNDAYTGSNSKRGSYNAIESGLITSPNGYKGIRQVWGWDTSSGNGSIASVCLTRSAIAVSEYSTSVLPTDGDICEVLTEGGSPSTNLLYLGRLHIVDWEREWGYRVRYENSKIYIDRYQLATKNVHIVTRPYLYNSADPSYAPEFVDTKEINQALTWMNDYSSSISYTGDKIVIVTWNGSGIKAYPISTSTWELDTIVEKTFDGVTFVQAPNATYKPPFHKDVVLLDGTDAWIMAAVSSVTKMLKIDLLGATVNVKSEKAVPTGIDNTNNGPCMLMQNGDFYKFPAKGSTLSALYYHNNTFYICKLPSTFNKNANGSLIAGANSNEYGTALITLADDNYGHNGTFFLPTMHGCVSTINSLGETLVKDASLWMKLTYDITETNI